MASAQLRAVPDPLKPGRGALPAARCLLLAVGIAVLTAWVYDPVARHGFVAWDDADYVYRNPQVTHGLTADGLRWAFTTRHAANWHPLTWISHMLDVQFFGLEAGAHHVVNLIFHLSAALLLFGWLCRATRAPSRSALVAALFAVHPTHVESVAWVAERKDVLSAALAMLTLWCYVRYAERPGIARYGAVAAAFALALLAKPMVVTLPLVMLLLDAWPLARAPLGGPATRWRALAREKLPLLVLAVVASVLTVVAQSEGGAVGTLSAFSPLARIANAAVTYVIYLEQTLWPVRLAAFYPFHPFPGWFVVFCLLLLALLTFGAVRLARRHGWAATGWFWYLGTLVPVIGLLRVGVQARADRYTYLPSVGLFIAVAWGGALLIERLGGRAPLRRAAGVLASVVVIALAFLARRQVETWRNTETLWTHALAVTEGNYLAHSNLGYALLEENRVEEAAAHFREAFRIDVACAEAYHGYGLALMRQGHAEQALEYFSRAIRINPRYGEAYENRGIALAALGRPEQAVGEFRAAIAQAPADAPMRYNLGLALSELGRETEAEAALREALRLDPALAAAHHALGSSLMRLGRADEAGAELETALRLDPGFAEARNSLGVVRMSQGRKEEAVAAFREALRLRPDDAEAADNLRRATEADSGRRR